jgi:hypothetical protein
VFSAITFKQMRWCLSLKSANPALTPDIHFFAVVEVCVMTTYLLQKSCFLNDNHRKMYECSI